MNYKQQAYYEELYELIKGDYSGSIENQTAVWEDRVPNRLPLQLHCGLTEDQITRYPEYNNGEIHNDMPKMLLYGMKLMLASAQSGMQAVPSIRANMGCGIFPSLFPGINPQLFYDERMPWVLEHLTKEEIRNLREKDIKITDEFKAGLEHMVYQAEKINGTGTLVYPLDLQGPFDTAHIIYGDSFFYDLIEDPDLIHHLLELCVYAINLGLDECLKVIPDSNKHLAHYNGMVMPRSCGGIKVSEDTSTLVSKGHVDEFVIPYLNRVLEHAGGGYVHYCGKNAYLLDRLIKQDLVYGVNFGNPEMMDMDQELRRISAAGKIYHGMIPKHDNESYHTYFTRVIGNATVDGKCRLLLTIYSPPDDKAAIRNEWQMATDTI